MGILQEGLTRRTFLTGLAALIIPGCGPARKTDWNSMLTDQGKKVEADMAEAGIKNNGLHKLVPFERLTNNQRTDLGQDLPSSGFFLTTEASGKKIITFLLLAEGKNGKTVLRLNVPDSLIRNVVFREDGAPEAKLTFDLAKFINYSPSELPNKGRVFTIAKYPDPRNYINTLGAITEIEIRGDEKLLPPLPVILAK